MPAMTEVPAKTGMAAAQPLQGADDSFSHHRRRPIIRAFVSPDHDRHDVRIPLRATPDPRRRQFVVATIALAVASLSHGLTMPLLSLVLSHQGIDETLIGLNTGTYFIAIFAVAPFVSRLMRTRGPALLMLVSILAMAALFILLRAFPNVWIWFPLRFGLGVAASFLWIAGEAWVNHAADEAQRGRIIAIFGVVVSAGFALGPAILSLTGTEGWAPFLTTTGLLLAAGAVLVPALGSAPRLRGKTSGPLARYVLIAPVAMFGYFVFAAGDAVLLTFLPIYAVEIGLAEVDAVRLLAVLAIGSMALQYPIGWLATMSTTTRSSPPSRSRCSRARRRSRGCFRTP